MEDLVGIVRSCVNESNESVLTKLLALIQSWAFEYSSDRDLRGIAEVYMGLKDEGVVFPPPSEDDLKEADADDIEAFFNAHEDEDGPVLEVLENIMAEEEEDDKDPAEPETTTDEFNNFLAKRVVNVEVEALREQLKREVEQLPEADEDITAGSDIDLDEDIIADIEKELEENGNNPEPDIEEITSDEFQIFLSKRVEAVKMEPSS